MGVRLSCGCAAAMAAVAMTSARAPAQAAASAIALECSGTGRSEGHARRYAIRNPTRHAIPKGTVVHFSASEKSSGSVALARDLAPGASVEVTDAGPVDRHKAGAYACKASFFPSDPDLVVKSVRWSSATTATVDIENIYAFRDAPPSVVRVQSLLCLASPAASVEVPVPVVPKGATVSVTAPIARDGADYLKATANATHSIHETNTGNNVGVSPDFVTNRSCNPH